MTVAVAKVKAERWNRNNDVLNERYVLRHSLLRIGVARRVTTCRVAGTLLGRLAVLNSHHDHCILFGTSLEALAKVAEQRADVKHDTVRPRAVVDRGMHEYLYCKRDDLDGSRAGQSEQPGAWARSERCSRRT
jgi:hypothetical protein